MGGCSSKKANSENKTNPHIKLKQDTSNKDNSKCLEAKIVLLGDQNVGKSSIAQRFCKNVFKGQYVITIGGSYLQQKFTLNNGVNIKFHIWDTGGQERFRSMANLYYQDASAAILTYDITNEKTFDSMYYWIDQLKSKLEEEKIVICLAGNKCDCEEDERRVTYTKGKELADSSKMVFFETSAKNDIGIKELFETIGNTIYNKHKRGKLFEF